MEKTKVAILGAGFIADIHAESYKRFVPEAEIVAVYTRDKSKAEAFASLHSIPKFFDDLDDIIRQSRLRRRGYLPAEFFASSGHAEGRCRGQTYHY